MQTTLRNSVSFAGVGLHSGQPRRMTIHPAGPDHGIWFRRSDVARDRAMVRAHWRAVTAAPLCTSIVNAAGTEVSTIEHLMAALAGCGVHNALIELDGKEVPILDGSSAPFVEAILAAGLETQDAPVSAIRILRPVEVRDGLSAARLDPAEGLEIDFLIDFTDAAIGRQHKRLNMANGAFVHELSDSRTFCRRSDVEAMRAMGLGLGGTLDNVVVVDGAEVLSPSGLRHHDEAVRHKMLDALGDLALAGAPILGRYTGIRSGHALTNKLLRALFAQPDAWRRVDCPAGILGRLPGAGLDRAHFPAVA